MLLMPLVVWGCGTPCHYSCVWLFANYCDIIWLGGVICCIAFLPDDLASYLFAEELSFWSVCSNYDRVLKEFISTLLHLHVFAFFGCGVVFLGRGLSEVCCVGRCLRCRMIGLRGRVLIVESILSIHLLNSILKR
jgi:hypothetical protein